MGYDLHITRKKNWDGFDRERGREISLDEWIAVVNADPDLRIEGYVNRRLPDESVFRQPLAAWTAYSKYRAGDPGPALELSGGNVDAKTPTGNFAARCGVWLSA